MTKLPKQTKQSVEFLTGSEMFLCAFEKYNFLCLKFPKKLKSLKSDVSDTNGRQKCDFRVETVQNDTLKVDFRATATHFITFCPICIFVVGKFLPRWKIFCHSGGWVKISQVLFTHYFLSLMRLKSVDTREPI